MEFAFETIRFFDGKDTIKGLLLKYYTFSLSKTQLESIGKVEVIDGALHIEAHEKKRSKIMHLIAQGLRDLYCTITKQPAIYIDELSGVPLQGALEFGIIDRGSNVIEIRPCTGCNLACIYCSVHEGPGGPKKREYVIQKEYMLKEFDAIAKIKEHPIEVFIETMGEPLLYSELPELIAELKARDDVTQVTMVTNGTFLTPDRIKKLADSGLDRINWSINSLQPERARNIAGAHYNVERIKELILESKKHLDVLLCPVIMQGINDDELEDFVIFAQSVREKQPIIGFQNFLWYQGGRNPVKEMPMNDFLGNIKKLEEKYNTRLCVTQEDFDIVLDKSRQRPFRKKDIIEVEWLFEGRSKNEVFCKAKDRVVKVIGKVPRKDTLRVQIIRDKHNIFVAKPV